MALPLAAGSVSLSLNNDRYLAPPEMSPGVIAELLNVELQALDDDGFKNSVDWHDTPGRKRAYLSSFLRRHLGDPGVGYFWNNIWVIKNAVADEAGIQDSQFNQFFRYNFDKCYSQFQQGLFHVLKDSSGAHVNQLQKFSCGQKYCFWCSDRKRRRIAADYVDIIKQLSFKHGLRRIWSLVFTLPAGIENNLWERAPFIRRKLVLLVRKALGVRTRDNISVIIAEHPVGDSDIMRPRLHWHVIVIPVVLKKGHAPREIFADKLDLCLLRQGWNEVLGLGGLANQPEVKFFPTFADNHYRKISHRLRYDLRAFAQDIENAIARGVANGLVFILKKSAGDDCIWQAVTLKALSKQIVWIYNHARIYCYGWVRQKKTWFSEHVFDDPPVAEQLPVLSSEWARVELLRRLVYVRRLDRLVLKRSVLVYLHGRVYEVGDDVSLS